MYYCINSNYFGIDISTQRTKETEKSKTIAEEIQGTDRAREICLDLENKGYNFLWYITSNMICDTKPMWLK